MATSPLPCGFVQQGLGHDGIRRGHFSVLSSGVMQCCMAVQSVQLRADGGPRLLHGHLLFEMAMQMLAAMSQFHSGNGSQFPGGQGGTRLRGGGYIL